jgi:hypothetical protein
MSHTVKVKVELKDKSLLGTAVVEMQGTVLGEGTHRLYQGNETGFGFTLPKWSFPLVLKDNHELAFDDYNGSWGDRADVEHLTQRYAIHAAKQAAEAQGWLTERVDGGLIIYHPDGGTLTVKPDGSVDAANFIGSACSDATAAIESALGTRQEEQLKDSFFAERAHIHEAV